MEWKHDFPEGWKRKTFKRQALSIFFLIISISAFIVGKYCGILKRVIKYISCLFFGMISNFLSPFCVWQEKVCVLTFVFCISTPFLVIKLFFLRCSQLHSGGRKYYVGELVNPFFIQLAWWDVLEAHSGSKLSYWYWFSLPTILSFLQNCVCPCSGLSMCLMTQ